jgi:hypothetical protein
MYVTLLSDVRHTIPHKFTISFIMTPCPSSDLRRRSKEPAQAQYREREEEWKQSEGTTHAHGEGCWRGLKRSADHDPRMNRDVPGSSNKPKTLRRNFVVVILYEVRASGQNVAFQASGPIVQSTHFISPHSGG